MQAEKLLTNKILIIVPNERRGYNTMVNLLHRICEDRKIGEKWAHGGYKIAENKVSPKAAWN
jgi:hypothetical protein